MKRVKSESPEAQSVTVRFPVEMLEQLRLVAERSRRSLNAQILTALEEWLLEHDRPGVVRSSQSMVSY